LVASRSGEWEAAEDPPGGLTQDGGVALSSHSHPDYKLFSGGLSR
jgi:hypothetical protein